MNGCSLCNPKNQMGVGPSTLQCRNAWMGSYLCLPHSTSSQHQKRQRTALAFLELPKNHRSLEGHCKPTSVRLMNGGNEGARSCSGVCAPALWQAQPGWACKAARTWSLGWEKWCCAETLNESQGLVSRRTTVSPPYKHPDVTKKHSLHFQKENFRALVSFTKSWLKSWSSSWNTSKYN